MVNNVMERAAATTSMKLGDVANPSRALLSWSIADCIAAIDALIEGSTAEPAAMIWFHVGLKLFQHVQNLPWSVPAMAPHKATCLLCLQRNCGTWPTV